MGDQFVGDDGIVLDRALGFWIHRAHQALRNEMYRAFREVGADVTPEQWAVLVRLWERDGRTQQELCDATFRDKPTMSRIVDVLERRKLVQRRADPDDARTRQVVLTPAGTELRRTLVPAARGMVKRMLRGIDAKDAAVTRRTLEAIFANVS